jgi:hypothetical protein
MLELIVEFVIRLLQATIAVGRAIRAWVARALPVSAAGVESGLAAGSTLDPTEI